MTIINAFDRAKGAKKQYAASCAFLRALVPIFDGIKVRIETTEEEELQDDMLRQAEIIALAYAKFEDHLEKRHGLSSRKPREAKKIMTTIIWSMEELNDKVQKMQKKVLDAI